MPIVKHFFFFFLPFHFESNNFVFLFQLSPKIWTFLQQMGAIFHQVQLLAPFTKAMSCVLLANLAVENLFLESLGTMDLMLYLVSSRKSIKICKIEMILQFDGIFHKFIRHFFFESFEHVLRYLSLTTTLQFHVKFELQSYDYLF